MEVNSASPIIIYPVPILCSAMVTTSSATVEGRNVEESFVDIPDTAHIVRGKGYNITASGLIFGEGNTIITLYSQALTKRECASKVKKLTAIGLKVRVYFKETYWTGHSEAISTNDVSYSFTSQVGEA